MKSASILHSSRFAVFPSAVSAVFRPMVRSRNRIEWLDDGSAPQDRYLKKDGPRILVEGDGSGYRYAQRGKARTVVGWFARFGPDNTETVALSRRNAVQAFCLLRRLLTACKHTHTCVISHTCTSHTSVHQTRAWDPIVNCTITRPLPSSFICKFVHRRWAKLELIVCVWFLILNKIFCGYQYIFIVCILIMLDLHIFLLATSVLVF